MVKLPDEISNDMVGRVSAMVIGPLGGLLLHQWLGGGSAAQSVAADLSLITTGFLRLIKMLIAPLVFSTLTVGVARMEGTGTIARIGAKTLAWFLLASLVSMLIGIFMVTLLEPGIGLPLPAAASAAAPISAAPRLADILEHIIPNLGRAGDGEQRDPADRGVLRPVRTCRLEPRSAAWPD